jgi:O-acetyl-ADP-ribose deacetylase (regulator of RNase III)
MPIKFISINEEFTKIAKQYGYDAVTMPIEKYVPHKDTYYVSPANSLGFMDGGIDYVLSRVIFPGIETRVKKRFKEIGIKNRLGRYYLPIGSSTIIDVTDKSHLIVAPTMLLPQDVSTTENAYHSTRSILYNLICNRKLSIHKTDILLTSMCCGYGKMTPKQSFLQIHRAIQDYKTFIPDNISKHTVLQEPNLHEQPKIYQNTEWLEIAEIM